MSLVNIGGKAGKSQEDVSGSRKRVYIKTFGCQMNEYDTEKLYGLLANGYEPTTRPDKADLILVNTCSVRDKPEQKLYSLLGEYRRFKQDKPELMIGVGGCVAQQEGEKILKRSKEVDIVFGTHNLSLVPSLLNRVQGGFGRQVAVDYRDGWEDLPVIAPQNSRVSKYIAISRGCNKSCTYCIVPTTRGPEVSRPPEEILREARLAAHRGAKEVVLLGQTVNSYGLDLKPRLKFVELLEKIAEIPEIQRIRFTSPHPQEVREDFIDLIDSNPKVCKHIHMPLQSGSDRILKLMNRNYRSSRYLSIIEALKNRVPDIAITTDIIVGFPGETEEDFQATLSVMDSVQFDNSFSFVFSPRPGTPAENMDDSASKEEKLDRLYRLQARQLEITSQRLADWVGRVGEVLVDGPSLSDPGLCQGRLSQNILVNFTQSYEGLEPGQIVAARIKDAARFTLRAEIHEPIA